MGATRQLNMSSSNNTVVFLPNLHPKCVVTRRLAETAVISEVAQGNYPRELIKSTDIKPWIKRMFDRLDAFYRKQASAKEAIHQRHVTIEMNPVADDNYYTISVYSAGSLICRICKITGAIIHHSEISPTYTARVCGSIFAEKPESFFTISDKLDWCYKMRPLKLLPRESLTDDMKKLFASLAEEHLATKALWIKEVRPWPKIAWTKGEYT